MLRRAPAINWGFREPDGTSQVDIVVDDSYLPSFGGITQPMISLKKDVERPKHWEVSSASYTFEGSDMDAEPVVR